MHTITAPDGTTIAYDRTGAGEPLILIGGAFSYRRFPGQVKLAQLLSARFTVYSYDRRGRGDSGDTPPYAPERELEDIEALIADVGGPVFVYGHSSGGALALHTARRGAPITKLAGVPEENAPGDHAIESAGALDNGAAPAPTIMPAITTAVTANHTREARSNRPRRRSARTQDPD